MEPICILQHHRLTLKGLDIEQVRVNQDLDDETLATWEGVTLVPLYSCNLPRVSLCLMGEEVEPPMFAFCSMVS